MGVNSDMLRGFHDLMILYRLSLGDSYGYEISKYIRDRTDDVYTIKETTLYSTFNRLEKQGYVHSFSKKETKGRKRTYYNLTEAGRNRYEKLAEDWLTTKEIVNHFIRSENHESN
jgi:DNA-binding PadR family transcriptional regulator